MPPCSASRVESPDGFKDGEETEQLVFTSRQSKEKTKARKKEGEKQGTEQNTLGIKKKKGVRETIRMWGEDSESYAFCPPEGA